MSDLETRFSTLSLALLERYVADGQEENLHLEFKTLAGPDLRSQDDKRNFARALSGFANSEGGVVVWGVVAKKTADGPDCAQGLKPVRAVSALPSRLNEMTSDAVSPLVSGIQHRIVHENDDGSGFAVTLVPASDAGPHMAKAGVDQYFKRAGDSFVRMEHFDIADMFGRRPHPVLAFHLVVYSDGGVTSGGVRSRKFKIVGVIENSGRGSATAPYLGVNVRPPHQLSQYGVDGNGTHGLPLLVCNGSTRRFGASTTVVLHPGTSLEVFAVRGSYLVDHPAVEDLTLDFELSANDLALQTGTSLLAGSDIIAAVETLPSPF